LDRYLISYFPNSLVDASAHKILFRKQIMLHLLKQKFWK